MPRQVVKPFEKLPVEVKPIWKLIHNELESRGLGDLINWSGTRVSILHGKKRYLKYDYKCFQWVFCKEVGNRLDLLDPNGLIKRSKKGTREKNSVGIFKGKIIDQLEQIIRRLIDLILSDLGMKNGSSYFPAEIRILPLGEEEFETDSEVTDYLRVGLVKTNQGQFRFREKHMISKKGALILFQYQAKIWGMAIMTSEGAIFDHSDPPYQGYYQFDPDSVSAFLYPMSKDVVDSIWPSFRTKKLGQAQYHLDPSQYSHFMNVAQDYLCSPVSDEIIPDLKRTYREGAVLKVMVNAYERNPEARRDCIKHYGSFCYVCHFDFGKAYGEFANGFIHVHHLRPLSEIRSDYVVDPIKDMRPICPNCHAMIHRGSPVRSMKEVIKLKKFTIEYQS